MAAPEAMTYISPAHEAMKPFAERPAKDEKQEHGAMVGIPADVLNTYKPPLSDDTPNFYVENKQEKRVNVTQESLTAALEEAAEVQRRANEAYVKQFGQWPAELEALAKKEYVSPILKKTRLRFYTSRVVPLDVVRSPCQ